MRASGFLAHVFALVLDCAVCAAAPARSDDPGLARLFDRLAAAGNPAEAAAIEAGIWEAWTLGGGAAATSLMQVGLAALAGGNLPAALGVFDAIVAQNPDFAEGWNKRATVLYMMGALDRSAEDCARVLRLEPRHFGALSGLGLIRMRQERVEEAIDAFEKALVVHPHLEAARRHLDALRRKRRDGAI